jgi:hypothetical protein
MATRILWNESQFQVIPTTTYVASSKTKVAAGTRLFDMCGVNAAAMAESALSGNYVSTAALFMKMAPAGRCDATGRATINSIQAQVVADGHKNTVLVGYNGNGIPEATWRQFLGYHLARGAAVILETLNGQVLSDLITHQGEDATNLQRHFFSLYAAVNSGESPYFTGVKALPNGYVCADGASGAMNPVVNGARQRLSGHQMVYYPYAIVRASRPAALLAVYPKPAPAVTTTPAPQPQQPVAATTAATTAATNVTISLSPSELSALESLLARLPKP